MQLLHVVVNAETGEEMEREWYGSGSFKPGMIVARKGRDYEVMDVKVESRDTRRVMLQEVY